MMDLVSKELVDRFIESPKNKDAFPPQENKSLPLDSIGDSDGINLDFHCHNTFGLGLGFK